MKIVQSNIGGENRIALLDENNRPLRFYIWRDQDLNVDDIIAAKITKKNTLLRGYFAQTTLGKNIFIPTQAPYTEGQTVHVQITKEARMGKDANGIIVLQQEARAPDMAQKLAERLNVPIEQTWDELGLDDILLEALEPTIQFKNGTLHIERTSVCWTIDVDSATSTDKLNDINVNAIFEIAHQIVLRNLSGIILIDFAGFKHRGERVILEQKLKSALQEDDLSTLVGFTKSGLFEIRRTRIYASLQDRLCENGKQLSPLSVAYMIERRLKKTKGAALSITAHPSVLVFLKPKWVASVKFISDLNRSIDSFEIKE